MKACRGSRGIAPLILNVGNKLVEWSGQSLGRFIFGKESRYQLNRRLDGPHMNFGRAAEEKNLLPLSGFELRVPYPVA
jgi:hypothetical protein